MMIMLAFIIIGSLTLMIVTFIDIPTVKNTGIEYVDCVDDHGRKFVDEKCIKKTTCSWLGMVSDEKCVKEGLPAVGGKK